MIYRIHSIHYIGLGELEEKGYDLQLGNWNGTIIGPQNV
jgi:hypothetical protein